MLRFETRAIRPTHNSVASRVAHTVRLTVAWLAPLLLLVGCDDDSSVQNGDDTSAGSDATVDAMDPGDSPPTTDADAGCSGVSCPCEDGFSQLDGGVCAPVIVDPVAPALGDLLIEEFYYSGAAPAGGTDHYFSDQFIELVNTAATPLDLSGVMIGDAFGAAGAINPGMMPDSFAESLPDVVVLESVWRIPEGTVLPVGATLVIAHDGTNHQPFSTIDLSGAAFETYVATSGRDDDYPTVDNLESVVFNGGSDWLVPVFGASIVVLRAGTELGAQPGPFGPLSTAPNDAVLDAVEALMDASSEPFKRLPDGVDTGFSFVADTYVGESLHRVESAGVYQDTNNSSIDFVIAPPDPGKAPEPIDVFGQPDFELGTGVTSFTPLIDGDSVELVSGLQGGWHIDGAVRFRGFGPDGVLLVYDAVDAQSQPVSLVTQALLESNAVIEETDGWSRVGDRIVLTIFDPAEVVGSTITLRVTAELGGESWSDEKSVTVVDLE